MSTQTSKILVVDDEATAGKSIEKILAKKGFAVDIAQSAAEGLKKMEAELFELVLLDIMMPQVNGIELLTIIKKKWPSLNVVMITGYPSIETAVEATRLGAYDYIPKPFTPDELRDKVGQALEHGPPGELIPFPGLKDRPSLSMCPLGEQACEIYAKKGKPCKTKDGICPKIKKMQLEAQARPRPLVEEIGKAAIDVDIPFDYHEVARLTGPGYVDALGSSDMPAVSWGKAEDESLRPPMDVDMPFSYDDVARWTGPEYVNALDGSDVPLASWGEKRPIAGRPSTLSEILVIDDEVVVGNSVRKILEPRGCHVEHAETPEAAIGVLSERPIDMILLDMKIPGVKGLELLKMIREEYPTTPVIMITGYASVQTAVDSMKMGAADYVPKPFTPTELHHAVERGLKRAA